jgi:hypothetical protein
MRVGLLGFGYRTVVSGLSLPLLLFPVLILLYNIPQLVAFSKSLDETREDDVQSSKAEQIGIRG